ncbi:hypothetical protein I317_00302 [Kwoniella heveanensis CBS 569]|nr:hypothetical protein I317_00302 [Kwoniella heveanensis CBS 569]
MAALVSRAPTKSSRSGMGSLVKSVRSRMNPAHRKNSQFSFINSRRDSDSLETNYSGDTAIDGPVDHSELFSKTKDHDETDSQRSASAASRKFGEWISRQTAKLISRQPAQSANHGFTTGPNHDSWMEPPPPYREKDEGRSLGAYDSVHRGRRAEPANASTPGFTSFGLVLQNTGRSLGLPVEGDGYEPQITRGSYSSRRLSDPYAGVEHPDYTAMGLPPSRPISAISTATPNRDSAYSLSNAHQPGFDAAGEPHALARAYPVQPALPRPWPLSPGYSGIGRRRSQASFTSSIASRPGNDERPVSSVFSWSDDELVSSVQPSPRASSIWSIGGMLDKMSGVRQNASPRSSSSGSFVSGISNYSIRQWARQQRQSAASSARRYAKSASFAGMTSGLKETSGRFSKALSGVFPSRSAKAEEARARLKRSISGPVELIGEPTYVAVRSSNPPDADLTDTSNRSSDWQNGEEKLSRASADDVRSADGTSNELTSSIGSDSQSRETSGTSFELPIFSPDQGSLADLRSSLNSIADRYSLSESLSGDAYQEATSARSNSVFSSNAQYV